MAEVIYLNRERVSESEREREMRSSTNYLLVKDDVGKSKPSTRTLPKEGHTFGLKNIPDAVNARGCK